MLTVPDGVRRWVARLRRIAGVAAFWWWLGLTCQVAAWALMHDWGTPPPVWARFVVVIGPLIIDRYRLAFWLMVAGAIVFWITSLAVWVHNRPRASRSSRIWRIIAVVMAWLVSIPSLLISAVAGLVAMLLVTSNSYHALSPASPQGCRVITDTMWSMSPGTWGSVYVTRPGSFVATLLDRGGWSAPDSDTDPIREGRWLLRWDGDSGGLFVNDQATTIKCPPS